ncbi:hypothetical protein EVAR_84788_1 [Eumeta japonica]|uniref:Uncharacterized protein n=1 Tax=Eumeta variegata TaxID=151549 RepID=A0A4C1U8X2_EUMVA|nr:hypothetical protein EVAR_84788_1 [Eumeta japonica]
MPAERYKPSACAVRFAGDINQVAATTWRLQARFARGLSRTHSFCTIIIGVVERGDVVCKLTIVDFRTARSIVSDRSRARNAVEGSSRLRQCPLSIDAVIASQLLPKTCQQINPKPRFDTARRSREAKGGKRRPRTETDRPLVAHKENNIRVQRGRQCDGTRPGPGLGATKALLNPTFFLRVDVKNW